MKTMFAEARPLSIADVPPIDQKEIDRVIKESRKQGILQIDAREIDRPPDPERKRPTMATPLRAPLPQKTRVPLILSIMIAMLTVVGAGTWLAHHKKALNIKAGDSVAKESSSATAPATTPAPQAPTIDFEVAGVHKGQGEEHVFARLLIADPSRAAHTKWEYTGDLNDKLALKKWAQHTSAVIAIGIGHVNWKFGEEARVKKANTIAFDIKNDGRGNLTVVQYATTTAAAVASVTLPSASRATASSDGTVKDGVRLSMVKTYTVAQTAAASQFIGGENDSTVFPAPYNQYFYMYTGD